MNQQVKFTTYNDDFAVEETTTSATKERVFLVSQAGEFLEGFTVKKLLGLLEDMDTRILMASTEDRNPTEEEQVDMDTLRCAAAIIDYLAKQFEVKS